MMLQPGDRFLGIVQFLTKLGLIVDWTIHVDHGIELIETKSGFRAQRIR